MNDSSKAGADPAFTLYTFWRSSAAYRVRIALGLKGLDWRAVPVNLARGEQRQEEFVAANPQGLVPALRGADGVLNQSLAIIEYLEERYPNPALLPADAPGRATVRGIAHQIAMDMHPLNNLRVLNYLSEPLGLDEKVKLQWYRHWIREGFTGLERTLRPGSNGAFCYGSTPTLADVCLVPQVYNAQRFECPLDDYPLIVAIAQHCGSLDAFRLAAPQVQADCPEKFRS